MKKSIIKEILLTLLVTVAVVLILAVIFYQYIPSNRVIPSKVTAYQATEEVAEEINQDSTAEIAGQNQTYEITDEDLLMYKKIDSYRPGKVDPFAASSPSTSGGEGGNSGTTTPGNNENNENQEKDKNTTDNYYTASGIGGSSK